MFTVNAKTSALLPVWTTAILLAGCPSWEQDNPNDPTRCDPACTGLTVCFEGTCVPWSMDGFTDISADQKADAPGSDAAPDSCCDLSKPDQGIELGADLGADVTVPDVTVPDVGADQAVDAAKPDAPCTTCPTGFVDLDKDPKTGVCGCEYACTKTSSADPIDPKYVDANCDGSDGVVADCVFVSPSLGTSIGDGSRQKPVDTIAAALTLAVANKKGSVCLAGELFSKNVTLVAGVGLYGGFDPGDKVFKWRRSAKVTTTLQAAGTVVLAAGVDKDTHLEGLTIIAQSPAGSGKSTYGVRLTGGSKSLYVRYNTIKSGHGTAGDGGANGTAHSTSQAASGSNGKGGCDGCSCNGDGGTGGSGSCGGGGGKGGKGGYDNGWGKTGSSGSGTGAGSGGKGSDWKTCNMGPGAAGSSGNKGAGGTAGAAGAAGDSPGKLSSSGEYLPGDGGDGVKGDDGAGGGGGGGGGGASTYICKADRGGGGGGGGGGGLAGTLGTGGKGGGGSFGVLVLAGSAVVEGNTITTGDGGDGGKGGTGAAGQKGGDGGTGGGGKGDASNGGGGGAGGSGGAGGHGGGGGGGCSACLTQTVTSVVTYKANTCTFGKAGVGGASSGNSGKNGTAVEKLQL